ncbi:hypothetical protein [Carboxylicivirga sp. RSCT41]|uniref:hypothetical protein n=1 Tax=Carboxylicivirga agarovorans TaxID=3417570 RepID=UPI003D3563CE
MYKVNISTIDGDTYELFIGNRSKLIIDHVYHIIDVKGEKPNVQMFNTFFKGDKEQINGVAQLPEFDDIEEVIDGDITEGYLITPIKEFLKIEAK